MSYNACACDDSVLTQRHANFHSCSIFFCPRPYVAIMIETRFQKTNVCFVACSSSLSALL